jgi:hypothetical protein
MALALSATRPPVDRGQRDSPGAGKHLLTSAPIYQSTSPSLKRSILAIHRPAQPHKIYITIIVCICIRAAGCSLAIPPRSHSALLGCWCACVARPGTGRATQAHRVSNSSSRMAEERTDCRNRPCRHGGQGGPAPPATRSRIIIAKTILCQMTRDCTHSVVPYTG